MIGLRRLLGTLRQDRRGATLVEFALILPVMCVVILGLLDLGYRSYVASAVQGALFEAARLATVGNTTGDQLDARIRSRLSPFAGGDDIVINKNSYYDFTNVKKPEVIVNDTIPLGEYNPGDCFRDANGNGKYDLDRGKSGLGGSDDIVHYEIVLTYDRFVPISMLGGEDRVTVASGTSLRNQPFASRAPNSEPEICV